MKKAGPVKVTKKSLGGTKVAKVTKKPPVKSKVPKKPGAPKIPDGDYLESVFEDNVQGFWYPDLEYEITPEGRTYRPDISTDINPECSKLFPSMKFSGKQSGWRVNGGLSELKTLGKPHVRKYVIKSPIKLGITDELFRVEGFPLSYLVCGQLSGKNWSDMIKDYSKCSDRNCCSEIARNITNAMIRSFSSKIFSNKTQPFYELMANSVDAVGQNASVGKFGIGFFSALGLITDVPMRIISFTDGKALRATIRYEKDQYVIDLVCYKSDHASSGTVISISGENHRFYGSEVTLPKKLVKVNYGKMFSIHDMGKGITPDEFFTKLLLPTISTKKETVYSKNSFTKPKVKRGLVVRVNGYQIWNTHDIPNLELNFSNKYGVPISRDDIIFQEKDLPEILAFMKEVESGLSVTDISHFEKRIVDLIRKTNNPVTKKIFAACLRDSYRRNNIRTVIPFLTSEQREANRICDGNCLDIKATEEVLKRIFPGVQRGSMYLIKAQVPVPSSYDLANILFYPDEKSLETVTLELRSYEKEYPIPNESTFATPALKRLRDVFYYVVTVKANYSFPIDDFCRLPITLENSGIEFKDEIYSFLGSLIFRYQGRITNIRNAAIPKNLSKPEVFEALAFMYKYVENSTYIPFPLFYEGSNLDLESAMRLGPNFIEKGSQYLNYWNSMNLRNYPNFNYGLFYPIELPTFTRTADKLVTTYPDVGNTHTFSLNEQIQAALSYDRSIVTAQDFFDFIEFVKSKKYHRAQVQNIKLAINFGTPREYSESVLYELLQNAKDAGATNIEIKLEKNILQITDNASGISPTAYLSLSIPFYSSKKASDRGQIGSGFFNIYKKAKEVIIYTVTKDWILRIVDIPQRDLDGTVVDLRRTVSVIPLIQPPTNTGTAITIKTILGEQELYYLGRVKKAFEDALKFDKSQILAENSKTEIYVPVNWQESTSVLMLDGIPHSILKDLWIGKYTTVNLKKGAFEISQSRTADIGVFNLTREDRCFISLFDMIIYPSSGKNIRSIMTNKDPFFYVKEFERERIISSLDNYVTFTPYGLKRLKDLMNFVFDANRISFEDITRVRVSAKTVTVANKEAESVIVAFCEAWSHLAIDKKIVAINLAAVEFKDIVALGLYAPSTKTITVQKEVYSRVFGLKQKILTKPYLEIVNDPDWRHLFGIDALQAPTVIHELEHYRDDSGHGSSNHESHLNPRINYEYVLDGLHTFDSRALSVTRYLFCNGLYDLIREKLRGQAKK